jgi:hypothetical protein
MSVDEELQVAIGELTEDLLTLVRRGAANEVRRLFAEMESSRRTAARRDARPHPAAKPSTEAEQPAVEDAADESAQPAGAEAQLAFQEASPELPPVVECLPASDSVEAPPGPTAAGGVTATTADTFAGATVGCIVPQPAQPNRLSYLQE